MSKLSVGKLARNLDNLMSNVKTIVSPGSVIPEDASDKITKIMYNLSAELEKVVSVHAAQTKTLDEIHINLSRLFKELEVLKAGTGTSDEKESEKSDKKMEDVEESAGKKEATDKADKGE